jgi:hypothetical protein
LEALWVGPTGLPKMEYGEGENRRERKAIVYDLFGLLFNLLLIIFVSELMSSEEASPYLVIMRGAKNLNGSTFHEFFSLFKIKNHGFS